MPASRSLPPFEDELDSGAGRFLMTCPRSWAVGRGTILVNVYEPSVKNGITTGELESHTVSLGDCDGRVWLRACKIPGVDEAHEADRLVDCFDSWE